MNANRRLGAALVEHNLVQIEDLEQANLASSMDFIWLEFFKVALAHLLAVASPGPDFAIVLRQSLRHGRRTAIWTSVGVGMAITLHVMSSAD